MAKLARTAIVAAAAWLLVALVPTSVAVSLHVQRLAGNSEAVVGSAPLKKATTASSADRDAGNHDDIEEQEDEKLPEDYAERAAAIESKCMSLQKCLDLCAWVSRAFVKKYGSAEKAFLAADSDADGEVRNEDFVAQCLDAGVSDAAMSTRGYIFLYIVDISLDGTVSLEGYQRISMLGEMSGEKDSPSSVIGSVAQHEIESSTGWGAVKVKDPTTTLVVMSGFPWKSPPKPTTSAEPLNHSDYAEAMPTSTTQASRRPPPRPEGKSEEKKANERHGARSAAQRRHHHLAAFVTAAAAAVVSAILAT
jgi:hypothetical protein